MKMSRIDIIGQNGNDGDHYKECNHEFTIRFDSLNKKVCRLCGAEKPNYKRDDQQHRVGSSRDKGLTHEKSVCSQVQNVTHESTKEAKEGCKGRKDRAITNYSRRLLIPSPERLQIQKELNKMPINRDETEQFIKELNEMTPRELEKQINDEMEAQDEIKAIKLADNPVTTLHCLVCDSVLQVTEGMPKPNFCFNCGSSNSMFSDDEVIENKDSGLDCSYYDVQLDELTHDRHAHHNCNIDESGIQFCCNDLIEHFEMDYPLANVFKAVWRIAAARKGKYKKGNSTLYDAEKMKFFSERTLIKEKKKANKY